MIMEIEHISRKSPPPPPHSWRSLARRFSHFLLFRCDPFFLQFLYFLLISLSGFLVLRSPAVAGRGRHIEDLDLFFTSVSASTVSSMNTVEMESLSPAQLWVLVVLMLAGGEVFTSLLGLQFTSLKLRLKREDSTVGSGGELEDKREVLRWLGYAVLGYLLCFHLAGIFLVSVYFAVARDAREVLRRKAIGVPLFAVFLVVSSFSNCGFVPTNENMAVFKNDSALLLMVIPQMLAGNTLFPCGLRLAAWVAKRAARRKELAGVLRAPEAVASEYKHLLPRRHCVYLAATAVGFVAVQVAMVCAQEWRSSPEVLGGMEWYRKLVATLFEAVNSRHTGETIVDVSKLSPAILVLIAVMMYIPSYTYFVPLRERDLWNSIKSQYNETKMLRRSLHFSLICFPIIFVFLICITEREAFSTDPLNFNIFNVIFEVIRKACYLLYNTKIFYYCYRYRYQFVFSDGDISYSAHGNVGFSVGYSCERRTKVNPNGSCKDASYGFVGRWSSKGKIILMMVMLLGRLKKFQINGGKAWMFG
ncbi:probable cation transporter HKT6 isoform X1 [Zingiber officinale]|uniref:probable cation transporter HKT6 isoform X1 n=1 Tax=Zingiber officinale TaxID=94328 RepID=UPI001C4C2C7D|nr:probable cation transporter HKT6 isoform X1 [Zingiber officinale]